MERQSGEGRRLPDVGRVWFPLVGLAFGNCQPAPMLVSLENFAIAPGKHLRGNRLLHGLLDLTLRGPDIGERDGVAIFSVAQRIFAQVDVNASGEGEGHYQRRCRKIFVVNPTVYDPCEIVIAMLGGSYYQLLLLYVLVIFVAP